MDIHPPTTPVHSFREYCIHLSMVVLGIVIALGLENAVETHHSHQLAQRASRDMLAEIHSNRTQVEQAMSGLETVQSQLQLQVTEQKAAIEAQQHHAPLPPGHVTESNGLAFPVLSSAAWDSALAMQAVGRMDVETAKVLSGIYTSQLEVKYFQRTFLDLALHFASFGGRTSNDTPERMVDRLGAIQELLNALQNLLASYRDLLAQYANSTQLGSGE